jgi:hypothetical protein
MATAETCVAAAEASREASAAAGEMPAPAKVGTPTTEMCSAATAAAEVSATTPASATVASGGAGHQRCARGDQGRHQHPERAGQKS